MNILLFGSTGSGKSLLAKLLAEHYKVKGHEVELLEEEKAYISLPIAQKKRYAAVEKLENTLHNPTKHTIVTTQALPSQILRFYDSAEINALWDYYYRCFWRRL